MPPMINMGDNGSQIESGPITLEQINEIFVFTGNRKEKSYSS